MMRKRVPVPIVIAAALLLGGIFSRSAKLPRASAEEPQGAAATGMDALQRAAQRGKYLFIFFHEAKDEQTSKMRAVFDGAMKKVADRAESVAVNTTDSSEKGIVDRFGVAGAPMPLVLAVAPNDIITGGFPREFSEQQILDAIAGPCLLKCLRALKDGKLLFICVRNKAAAPDAETMKAVKDFEADPEYADRTQIVELDPTDAREGKLTQQLNLDPKEEKTVIVFLSPPGVMVGKFTGATTKDALVEALSKATARCGTGCGSRSGFS